MWCHLVSCDVKWHHVHLLPKFGPMCNVDSRICARMHLACVHSVHQLECHNALWFVTHLRVSTMHYCTMQCGLIFTHAQLPASGALMKAKNPPFIFNDVIFDWPLTRLMKKLSTGQYSHRSLHYFQWPERSHFLFLSRLHLPNIALVLSRGKVTHHHHC